MYAVCTDDVNDSTNFREIELSTICRGYISLLDSMVRTAIMMPALHKHQKIRHRGLLL